MNSKKYYISVIILLFAFYIFLLGDYIWGVSWFYFKVAWEMYAHHHIILPTLNLHPYTQKPPILFWLILTCWHLMSQGERKRGRRTRDRQGFLSEPNDRRSEAAKVVVL